MLNQIKTKLLSTVWPYGSKAKIYKGPLKGSFFKVSANSGWSPIVGRWEPESQELFPRIVSKGNIAYDLGANNGIHSLLLSKLVGSEGKVFSLEPLLANCDEIRANSDLNNVKNIEIINAAVGEKS